RRDRKSIRRDLAVDADRRAGRAAVSARRVEGVRGRRSECRDKSMSGPLPRVLILHNRYRQPGREDAVVAAQAGLLRARGPPGEVLQKDNREIDGYGLLRKAALFFEMSENSSAAAEVEKLAAAFKPNVALVHNFLPLLSPSIYKPLRRQGAKIIQYLH